MSRALLASLMIASAVAAVGCESDDNRSSRSGSSDNSQPVAVESSGRYSDSGSNSAYNSSANSNSNYNSNSGVVYQNADGTPWRGYPSSGYSAQASSQTYPQSNQNYSQGSTYQNRSSQSGSYQTGSSSLPQSGTASSNSSMNSGMNSGMSSGASSGASAGGYGSDRSAAGNYATSDWRSGNSTYNNTGRGADVYAERSGTAVTASERQGPNSSSSSSSSSTGNTGSPGNLSGQPADNTNGNWTNRNTPGSFGTGTNAQSVQNNPSYNQGSANRDNSSTSSDRTSSNNNNSSDANDNARTAAERMGMGPLSPADKMFLVALSGANQAEIDTAQLAQNKNNASPQVKQIAQQMIQDHQQAQQQLQDLARRKDVDIDTSAPQAARSAAHELDKLDGTQFDQQYLAVNRAAHQATIAQVQFAAQNATDPDVRMFAQQLLPKLQGHAQQLNQAAGQGMSMPGHNMNMDTNRNTDTNR